MSEKARSEKPDALFDISTVARLTGLSAANIRAWEKRYSAVVPARSESRRRLYTGNDVRRLTLLKSLVDHGHPIRSTAQLSDEELESRLHKAASAVGEDPVERELATDDTCRLLVVGNHLVTLLETEELAGTRIVATFDDLDSAETTGNLCGQVDLLLIDCPTLFTDTADRIRRLIDATDAARAIVVYHYAQNKTLEMMGTSFSRITAIRAPININELRLACAAGPGSGDRFANRGGHALPPVREFSEVIPERNFSDKQLVEISSAAPKIDCECPHHLASILTTLVGFEMYSSECESRNASDAEVHAYLHKTTAHVRAIMEDALQTLIDFEGIEVSE